VSFLLHPQEKSPQYPLGRRLCEHQSYSRNDGNEKVLPEIETHPSSLKPVVALIELSWLISSFYVNGQEMNCFYGTCVEKTATWNLETVQSIFHSLSLSDSL
jgi:hypothetical protein